MKLREYQEKGRDFLSQDKTHLALFDDMGLGKTPQAATACVKVGAQRILVVCPAAARINWQREFAAWTPFKDFKVCEKLTDRPAERMVCSYNYITKNFSEISLFFDVIIFDEVHFIKGTMATRSGACFGADGIVHKSKRVWALTGTPTPNGRANELWVLLYTFGYTHLRYNDFVERYCHSYISHGKRRVTGTKKTWINEIKNALAKFSLRRLKSEVLKDLPPIRYGSIKVAPGKVDQKRFFETNEDFQRQIQIADEMGYDFDGMAAVADSIASLCRYIGHQKIDPVVDIISKELENNAYQKIVLFARHKDVIDQIAEKLKKFKPVKLYGATGNKARQKAIDDFQNKKSCRVFIGNILAAGTAITLTAASEIALVESDHVPGNNAQAIMRVHRFGQKDSVNVRIFSVIDSYDERISESLIRKTEDITLLLS